MAHARQQPLDERRTPESTVRPGSRRTFASRRRCRATVDNGTPKTKPADAPPPTSASARPTSARATSRGAYPMTNEKNRACVIPPTVRPDRDDSEYRRGGHQRVAQCVAQQGRQQQRLAAEAGGGQGQRDRQRGDHHRIQADQQAGDGFGHRERARRYRVAAPPAASRSSPQGTTPTRAKAAPAGSREGSARGSAIGGSVTIPNILVGNEYIQMGYYRRWHTTAAGGTDAVVGRGATDRGGAVRAGDHPGRRSAAPRYRQRRRHRAGRADASRHGCSTRHPRPRTGRGRPTTVLGPHADGPLVLAADLRAADWRLALAGHRRCAAGRRRGRICGGGLGRRAQSRWRRSDRCGLPAEFQAAQGDSGLRCGAHQRLQAWSVHAAGLE